MAERSGHHRSDRKKKPSHRLRRLVLPVGAAAGVMALRARRRDALANALFEADATTRSVTTAAGRFDLPIRYYRTDAFLGTFAAAEGPVRELLPSGRLQPVRLPQGKVAVVISAYNYVETGIGPYGEIAVAVPVTLDRHAPPGLPLLLESRLRGFGAFVAHLPVTTALARDAGRDVWGFPKFVADMQFDLRPEHQSVLLGEGGRHILTLEVARRGGLRTETAPLVTFSVLDGELVRTEMPTRAVARMGGGPGAGTLVLGDHPVAEEIRALGLSPTPLATKSYLSHAAVLPEGVAVGPADRSYGGFAGTRRASGLHTVRYDDRVERVVTTSGATREVAA